MGSFLSSSIHWCKGVRLDWLRCQRDCRSTTSVFLSSQKSLKDDLFFWSGLHQGRKKKHKETFFWVKDGLPFWPICRGRQGSCLGGNSTLGFDFDPLRHAWKIAECLHLVDSIKSAFLHSNSETSLDRKIAVFGAYALRTYPSSL